MRKESDIRYLCDPITIETVLESFPRLRERLRNTWAHVLKSKGSSSHFPNAVYANQEIYRILSNQHYPHLVQLLNSIEFCLKNDYENRQVLTTTSLDEFESGLSEILFAEICLRENFHVHGLDANKRNRKTSDLRILTRQGSFIAEVYRPRTTLGLRQLEEELRLAILHLDLPYDFECEIRFDVEQGFSQVGRLEHFKPSLVSSVFSDKAQKRRILVDQVLASMVNLLPQLKDASFEISLGDRGVNAKIQVGLSKIQQSQDLLPHRLFVLSQPGSGIGPEFLFDDIVRRRIRSKIRDRQFSSYSEKEVRLLIVDISDLSFFFTSWNDGYYRHKFISSIETHLTDELKLSNSPDLIVLFAPKYVDRFPIMLRKSSRRGFKSPVLWELDQVFERIDAGNDLLLRYGI